MPPHDLGPLACSVAAGLDYLLIWRLVIAAMAQRLIAYARFLMMVVSGFLWMA